MLQWGLFDKQFGRTDTQEPDPEGRVPQWQKASVQEMKDKFAAVGFGPRQVDSLLVTVALLWLWIIMNELRQTPPEGIC